MDNEYCKNCKHFMQHYGLNEKGIFRLYCGHCTLTRSKHKRPDQKACSNYIFGENRESTFASKEYLSKALLDKIFALALLPEHLQDELNSQNTP